MRVLLVEDDREISLRLSAALGSAGFVVEPAYDGEDAYSLGSDLDFDAVVLDLGLPNMSGLEVLRRWRRAQRDMPVLVLSARDTWTHRVEGLNAGADDYLGKPFQNAEVIARLRALLRRSAGVASPVLRVGDCTLDPAASAVSVAGQGVDLTARELMVLSYLMHRPGRVVSQHELMDHLYPVADARESNTIEVFIARLRRKLGRESIRTVRGLGYRMG